MTNPPLHYPALEDARLPERLIFGHRPTVLVLFFIATIFLGWQAWHLQPDASFSKLIPQGHPFVQRMNSHMKDLRASGASLKVSVAVSEGDIFDDEYLSTLGQIADEIFYIPGVNKNRLKSLWSPDVRWIMVTEEGTVTSVRLEHSRNASPQMLVTEDGIVTWVTPEEANAQFAMLVTGLPTMVAGISTLPPEPV